MARVLKTVTFMVLVFAAVVLAEDYDVGDDTKWTRPTDVDFYSTWATGKTFLVGDELEFEFAAGRHDVAVVTADAYETCNIEKPISLMTVSPVKIRLNTSGPQYFICTVGDHCMFGQKLTIDVVGAGGLSKGGGATPAPGGAKPSAGGTPPTTAPGGTTSPTTAPDGTTTPSDTSGTTTPTTPTTPTTTTTTPPAGNAASSLGGSTLLAAFVSAVVALF